MDKVTLKSYLKPAFILCFGVLFTAAAAKEAVIRILGIQMVKVAIPLKQPLDEMSASALIPFELRNKLRIENRDVLESLGTEEYMQWILEDSTAKPQSPTRYCSLFITYYTGTPDMVPHIPNECYTGAGDTLRRAETMSVGIDRTGEKMNLNFQYVVFDHVDSQSMKEDTFSVQYFFHANGEYCESRTDTRWLLGSNWFSKYSYFCKVEWKFYGGDSFGKIYPDKDQTLEASTRLMDRLLPVLETDHWPDWNAANQRNETDESETQLIQ